MSSKESATPEAIQRLLTAFEGIGVSKGQIEKRLGRKVDSALSGAVLAQLRKIFAGIRDGMAKPEEFFEPDLSGAGSNAIDSVAGEGQAKTAGGKTGGSTPPTGASAEPSDWDAFADELISSLQGAADVKTLDALLDEFQESIGKLQASGDKAAMKKWSSAVLARRNALTGGKLV